MSDTTSESPPTSPPPIPPHNDEEHLPSHPPPPDLVTDILFWRNKRLNIVLLFATTVVWLLMEIYQYSFVTLFSYSSMALLLMSFLWGSTHRFLQKEAPDLSGLVVSEEAAMDAAKLFRRRAEEGVRMIFHVSMEIEWFVFAGVVGGLYLLSLVGRYFDLLTLCYLGVIGGVTMPVIYRKNEVKIREMGEKLRKRSERLYGMVEEKVVRWKDMMMAAGRKKEVKVKKTE